MRKAIALLVIALSACTTVYVVSGSGSIETEQRIGRRIGPLVGDSDNTNSSTTTQPRKATP
jgi:hypothetical protein